MFKMLESLRPRGYTMAAMAISIGGVLNGYDTGSIGAITTMPYFESTFGVLSPTMRGFTVSSIMLMAALPSVFTGQLADHYGHLRVVMVGSLVFAVGAILEAASSELSMFLVGRALCGTGEGLWLANVSVYITEIAPSAKRGILVSIPQLLVTTGLCAGYFTCYGSIHIDSTISWRLPFILEAGAAVLLAICCCYLPTSPRWLLVQGRRDEALRQLERLEIPKIEAEKDILRPEVRQQSSRSIWNASASLFKRQYRLRTMLGLFVLGMVQLSGIDGVLYYAPILFAQAGLPAGTASFIASGVSAILILAISIPAFLYADSWGRRTSVIAGGTGLSTCMFIIGCLYASDNVHAIGGAGRWFVVVLIFAFALIYAATWAIVGKIYASEVQPAQTRAAANSLAQGLNFFTNWLVAFATPIFLARSSYGAYFLFGGLSLFTVIVLAIFMPETRGQSLESIQDSFRETALRNPTHHVQNLLSGLRLRSSNLRGQNADDEVSENSGREDVDQINVSSREQGVIHPRIELRAL